MSDVARLAGQFNHARDSRNTDVAEASSTVTGVAFRTDSPTRRLWRRDRPDARGMRDLPVFTPFRFHGVDITDTDADGAADHVTAAALEGRALAVHLVNAYTLTLADKDPSYVELLNARAFNLPDGTPVSWFYRLLSGNRARGPVRGPDLMKALLARGGMTHFLLGGTDESLDLLEGRLAEDYPESTIVGRTAPPFRDPTDADIAAYADLINASGAHFVWVGVGTPRQDLVIAALVERVDCVLLGVGAAFDFLSGEKPEAPAYLHGTGLEWVHRLLSEPRRLWRRYLIGNAHYALLAARDLVAQRARARR